MRCRDNLHVWGCTLKGGGGVGVVLMDLRLNIDRDNEAAEIKERRWLLFM